MHMVWHHNKRVENNAGANLAGPYPEISDDRACSAEDHHTINNVPKNGSTPMGTERHEIG